MTAMESHLKGYTGLNIGLIFGGFCLLVAGYFLSIPLFTAIGGTFFGASLGSLFGRMANKDIIENFGLLSQPQKFTSEEANITLFRKEWHMYHVTKINGEFVWRYTLYDFSKESVPGYLQASVTIASPYDNTAQNHIVEAGIRKNKLVTLITACEGDEAGIHIFPRVEHTFRSDYCGIVDLTTWDDTPSISPVIIVSKPKYGTEPTIRDPEAKELDEFWISRMKTYGFDLLPRVTAETANKPIVQSTVQPTAQPIVQQISEQPIVQPTV
ncbi:hypothetical protein ASJ81_08135 [Methanosarcina spelaei]|uniref:Uncharacterized protein n=1 Tax=Methanosarcina spelaei TaxID=1036679 RepID=A0A2A2HRP1_9EURY|nr:PT domain-containing protein [Methanosarcina spelaei]PAV11995.1 hypothetical protein ASJ81_08135 [Methanosarcina spelaei]